MAIPIYVIGSSNTDMVVKVNKLPLPGETVMGGEFFMFPGGKGANQAVAASRLGGKVFLVAQIGQDVFGKQALDQFTTKENIDTSLVTLDPEHPSGVALIVVDAGGENSITVAPGSNQHLTVQKAQSAFQRIAAPAIILVQMEIPMDTIEYVIRAGNDRGLTVILNPAPAQPIAHQALKNLSWITPNETEAEAMTGIRVTDESSAAEAAAKLQSLGVAHVVVTLGAKGAFLLTDSTSTTIPAPAVEKVVDTTAAGDCFNGALAVALSEGMPLTQAISFACTAASRSVTKLGAQASLPYRTEINSLL